MLIVLLAVQFAQANEYVDEQLAHSNIPRPTGQRHQSADIQTEATP